MRLNLLFFLLLVFFAFSCSDGKDRTSTVAKSLASSEHSPSKVGTDTDTLLPGIPRFKEHTYYQPDSSIIAPPVSASLPPQKVKTRTNSYPVSSNKKVQNTGSLLTTTPGKNGIRTPVRRIPKPEVFPVKQLKPEEALPLRMKDIATYDIQYLDVDQGLVSSYIRAIMEDNAGNLWFGSSYGVSRYDGNTFIHYTNQSGLTDNTVVCMLQDTRGDIWFGTRTGATLYNGQEFIHYVGEQGIGNDMVRDILEDSHGDLWFGTADGLIRFERDSLSEGIYKYTKQHGLISNNILAIEEDDRGYLWFGSDEGLTRYDGTSFTQYTTASGLLSDKVLSIFKDSRGDIWFGTDKGVSRYDGNVFINYSTQNTILDDDVLSIIEDKRGDIWFGTNQGVFHYAFKLGQGHLTHYTIADGLSNNRVRSIVEDSKGNLWFGTGGGGVNRLKNTGFAHFTTSEGLTDNGVVFIAEDQDGTLWYGTEKGLNRYNGVYFTHYTEREGLPNNDVRCGWRDQEGKMWFGTAEGLSYFDGESFTNYTKEQGLPDDNILTLMQDDAGNFWLGTATGVCRFDPHNLGQEMLWLSKEEGLLESGVHALLEDKNGNIWMASEEGLCRYEPGETGGYITQFTTQNGLLSNYVGTMLEDGAGNLWFGTIDGLNLFDEDAETGEDQFIDYTTEDGLGNNVIWSILEDRKKNIWVSTEKGITLMKPNVQKARGKKPSFHCDVFDKGDGLKRLDFHANSVCLDRQNRLWWGSYGATMLDLSQYELTNEPPENLHLTHIEINQKFVDFRNLPKGVKKAEIAFRKALQNSYDSVTAFYNYPDYMDLSYKLDHLTFHFTAIDWGRLHRVEYQYYLEGLEDDWGAIVSDPQVDYRNLSFGHYTFKVQARGDNGAWTEPMEYHFHIRPAPWWAWWAWVIYTLIALAICFGIFQLVKKRWLLKNELKKEQEKSIRVSRRESFRSRLYTNLTHEFRTPLNVILGMSEQIESDPKRYLKEGVSLIQRNGEQLLRLINQLLDLAKLEDQSLQLHLQRGDVISYLHYYTDSFKTFAGQKGVNLKFETDVDNLIMDYDPEQIGHILTNLISNAVKFTPSGGRVTVRLGRIQPDMLLMEVTDTGIGIAQDNIAQIFQRFYQVDSSTTREGEGTGIGLAHTHELVKLMGGNIEVKSKVGQGTTFRVSLPIRLFKLQDAAVSELESSAELKQKAQILAPNLSGAEMPEQDLIPKKGEKVLPRVLIVEDNHDSMTFLVGCLADRYEVDLAKNGQIGVEKALETIPDLIISDVMMPGISGFDLCQVLKNDEKTSHIPIILLTAKADMDSKIKGLATGADAYLYKPFKKKELLVRLEAMMEKQRKLLAYFSKKFENGIVSEARKEEPVEDTPTVEDEFMEHIRTIVAENYHDESFTMMDICTEIEMSRSQLYRKMKALVGVSPSEFIRKYRLEKAKILLETTDMNASQVAYATGYKDPAHFSKSFLDEFNIHPSNASKKR